MSSSLSSNSCMYPTLITETVYPESSFHEQVRIFFLQISTGSQMGKPQRLRDTVATAARQHPLYGRIKVYLVANGDVERACIRLRAQDGPD